MLSLARSFARPTLSRSVAQRAVAIHTLPDLPYAHNVEENSVTFEMLLYRADDLI
jgi:hypothetical protein